jgi:hypothetical protein
MKQKKPYRLSDRRLLSAEPPFTTSMVREKLVTAANGPKRAATNDPNDDDVAWLTSTINLRHGYFFAAQCERARKSRREEAFALIERLRQLMPEIMADTVQETNKCDDILSRNIERAATELCCMIGSKVPDEALWPASSRKAWRSTDSANLSGLAAWKDSQPVDVVENVHGWQWVAPSLHADVAQMIGGSAAARFLAAVMPLLSGESPTAVTISSWLKEQRH